MEDTTHRKIVINEKEFFIKGNFFDIKKPVVSIVGTRSCTPQGFNDCKNLSAILASYGVVVISGGARGIDTAAHSGALEAKGTTGAILGCGIDVVYPNENRRLFNEISKKGFLLSEFPPTASPLPWQFPVRNKTIAQICDVLVVVEATIKGGSRITADHALDLGKTIFALPGNRRNTSSTGCNQLIYDGANLLMEPSDILDFLNISHSHSGWEYRKRRLEMSKEKQKIFKDLPNEAFSLYEASQLSGMTIGETSKLLVELTQAQLVVSKRGLWFKL